MQKWDTMCDSVGENTVWDIPLPTVWGEPKNLHNYLGSLLTT